MTHIIPEDLPQIQQILKDAIGVSPETKDASISRLGGLTNRSYSVLTADGSQYVVRIPGEGTESMINREHERISTELACRLGVDTDLLYFGEDGAKVSRYIPNAETMTAGRMQEADSIRKVAEILRTIHHSGVNTEVPFDVFCMAAQYESIIDSHQVPLFSDYEETKQAVSAIKAWLDRSIAPELQPCHNDPLCENWVMGQDRLYLVDWEYAGMNDGMWDLAAVSIEAGYDAACDHLLLDAYFGEDKPLEIMHLLASKIFVDYLWTLWAKARVPYSGQAMEDWAVERYTRLCSFLRTFRVEAPSYGIEL